MNEYDVVVLGGGPAGLAAALASFEQGMNTLIIERENRLGGILKQCIHDGFGLIKFKEKLTGPEYAQRYVDKVLACQMPVLLSTFVLTVEKAGTGFVITLVNAAQGVAQIETRALILATGCRERTAKQVFINGTRPAGVFTAGTAQHLVNIEGYLPGKKCVILGSGDIGLIMARRLTLEGAQVLAVYEAKSTPSGLSRNIVQCLNDFHIPLHLSTTITRVFGDNRVEAVEIARVDENMRPIKGTEQVISCDTVILSVGLIPENEIAEMLGIDIDAATKGPVVDQNFMTSVEGVFSCGNALHVNDLVDYVSESGEIAGENAAKKAEKEERKLIEVKTNQKIMYTVPSLIDLTCITKKTIFYFRSTENYEKQKLVIYGNKEIIFSKKYHVVKPPEMERVEIDLSSVKNLQEIKVILEDE